MTEENNQPSNENLDFHSGYKAHDLKSKPFPGKKTEEPRVFIEPEVFDKIRKHASETTAVELCGVLVGKTCEDSHGKYLVISASIRGEHARNEGAQVVFTHETWNFIHSEIEKNYQNLAIVGWYHTHPGFGIFLSDMDKFIQDYFFNQPFQVALVLDPVNSKEGLFAWIKGETRSLPKCWIGENIYNLTQGSVGSKTIQDKIPSNVVNSSQNQTTENSPKVKEVFETNTQKTNILTIFLALLLGFSISTLFLRGTFFRAALLASRAETREILGTWAADGAAIEDLQLLQGKINKMSIDYAKLLESSEQLSSIGASFSAEINEVKERLGEIASATSNRRRRVHRVLESVSNKTMRRIETSDKVMKKLRSVMGQSMFLQIVPYLQAMSTSPIDPDRRDEAKLIIQQIIRLEPRLETSIREQFPWLF